MEEEEKEEGKKERDDKRRGINRPASIGSHLFTYYL